MGDINASRKALLVGDANGADELKNMQEAADAAWAEFEDFSNKHMRVGKGWDLQVILDKMKEELKNESGSNQSERPKDKAGH